jgi:hypothetical protein
MLGRVLKATEQKKEARAAFERGIEVAESIEPEFQAEKIPEIRNLPADL